jgi:DNA topoisomerase-2
MNKVEITELPIGYTLKSYVNILNGLEDSKVLKSFEDRSDNDQFNFIVDFSRGVIRDRDEGFILDTLKLVKKVSENFTTIDQDNKIKVFNNDVDLLKAWVDIKLTYTLKRKKYMLSQMQHEGELLTSRYIFIKSVIDGDIIVTNTKKCDIIKQIKKVNGVIEKDGLYDYLLNMPIHSLTKEKVTMLKSKIKVLMVDIKSLKRKTEQELYMEDLDQL